MGKELKGQNILKQKLALIYIQRHTFVIDDSNVVEKNLTKELLSCGSIVDLTQSFENDRVFIHREKINQDKGMFIR